MWIAVDAMGGDNAPRHPVAGAVDSAREDGTCVLLVGREADVRRELAGHRIAADVARRLEVVHASEVVEMDDPPIAAIRKKRDSSIRVCATLVKEGRAHAMVSAGNTGAVMVCAKMVIGTSPGVDRPALAATLPNAKGYTILLDVGANIDTKVDQLRQFAVMGHFYAQEIVGVRAPRIGLLSIGEEQGKGSELTQKVFRVLETGGLNFIGNVEGSDVFRGTADVIVCDGFVGNVVLKSAESLAEMLAFMVREEFERRWLSRVAYLLMRPSVKKFRRRVDYSEYGGAPLLGIRGGCFIAHGRSNRNAIKNAIRRAVEFCQAGIAQKVSDKLEELQKPGAESLDHEELTTP